MADLSNFGLGNPFLGGNNPYLQQIIDSSSKDMVQNYNQTAAPAMNAAMLRSGSFGNSGVDEMTRASQNQLQGNLGDMSSKLRFNDYTQQQGMYQWQNNLNENSRQYEQTFDRNVYNDAYTQNMNNLQVGMGLVGTLGGYNAADVNNSTSQQNTPLNYWNQFQNASNGIANGFGSTTSSGTVGTTSNPVTSALGGAQLGQSAMNWWNGGGGGSSGSAPASGSGGGSGSWWA
ncbi:hypothetical protein [Variovorax sp. PAMC 28711]|uniref:hypothetical protein n=1 Tax=Variovorax sp. PAMC 28711 TaxID=1795631 RepID=UPI00078C2DD4|nr:hypothetical protein [Variovorax sp. PAMC 28711]AMM22988.1 hypothetical protein AX767_00285 [Variovorax sp. PAMC 28711]